MLCKSSVIDARDSSSAQIIDRHTCLLPAVVQVIDIGAVEQLVEQSQTRAISAALMLIRKQIQQQQQPATVAQVVAGLAD